uniref:GSTN-32 n=1 Tax=Exophiala pisciphila TaxID=86051 RepID=A0A077D3N5_9EURO|nr:GSTN-32 [Exophiala pisciphila]
MPSATDPAFSRDNPRVEMPMLVDGDLRIWDSTIILEYIEDKWPEPALLPPAKADPAGRARARMIEDVCDTHYEAVNWGLGEVNTFGRAEGAAAEKLTAQAKHQIKQVQTWLGEQLGASEWFGGDRFGWADLTVAVLVNRSASYGIRPEEGSALETWFARVGDVPAVKETLQECNDALKAAGPAFKDILRQGLMRRQYRDHRLEWMVKSGGIDIVLDGIQKKNIRFPWPDPLE